MNKYGYIGLMLVSLSVGRVLADGYPIATPWQPVGYLPPDYGGVYAVQTPKKLPTYIVPSGGSLLTSPGHMPSLVAPSYGGGALSQKLGQISSFLKPNGGSGYTIQPLGDVPKD